MKRFQSEVYTNLVLIHVILLQTQSHFPITSRQRTPPAEAHIQIFFLGLYCRRRTLRLVALCLA